MASIYKEGKYRKVQFRKGNKQFKRSLRTTSKRMAERLKIQLEDDLSAGTL